MPNYNGLNVSIGNTKLGSCLNVNLPAIITCRRDCSCHKDCYATKGCYRFPTIRKLYEDNLKLWYNDPAKFAGSLKLAIAAVYPRFFRWHSSGDIPTPSYIPMIFDAAETFPDVKFLIFTKRYEWVNAFLENHVQPANLSIVYSAWIDFTPVNPHLLPVAHVKYPGTTAAIPGDAFHCTGSCNTCVNRHCWYMKQKESVYFDLH